MSTIKEINGIRELMAHYDHFICDAWGVLHNGHEIFPTAAQALKELRSQAKTVLILSNAPRRNDYIIESLASRGVNADLYDGVYSSGELIFQALKASPAAAKLQEESYYYHLGQAIHAHLFDGLDFKETTHLSQADFILVTGPDDLSKSAVDFDFFLESCRKRNLLMLCANPDKKVINKGITRICAGAIAERYEQFGGEVIYYGKPYPAVYEHCLQQLGVQQRSSVIALGDSLATDIRGGNQAGLATVFIASGIHCAETMKADELIEMEEIQNLCTSYQVLPNYILKRLDY